MCGEMIKKMVHIGPGNYELFPAHFLPLFGLAIRFS